MRLAAYDKDCICGQGFGINVASLLHQRAVNGIIGRKGLQKSFKVGVFGLHSEYGTHGGLHGFGVEYIDAVFGTNYSVYGIPICKAYDGAKVTRVFYSIEHKRQTLQWFVCREFGTLYKAIDFVGSG